MRIRVVWSQLRPRTKGDNHAQDNVTFFVHLSYSK